MSDKAPTIVNEILEAIQQAGELTEESMDPRVALAHDLFSLADTEETSSATLITLVSACEVLANPQPRDADIIEFVEELRSQVRERAGGDDRYEAVLASMNLLHEESKGAAVRRLADRLPEGSEYGGSSPRRFLMSCYGARSDFVHEGDTRADVQYLCIELARCLSDLLQTRHV